MPKSKYPDGTKPSIYGRERRQQEESYIFKESGSMKTKWKKQVSSLFVCMVLIVAMALSAVGCGGKEKDPQESVTQQNAVTDGSVLGEGAKEFEFTIVDKDGNETKLEIHTDKETVGEALQELGLIDGEEGEYGLYVKSVNGISADYDTDGVYWAFYVNGEYAQNSVDLTPVAEGESYSFRVE